jgi:hypothetical protein
MKKKKKFETKFENLKMRQEVTITTSVADIIYKNKS